MTSPDTMPGSQRSLLLWRAVVDEEARRHVRVQAGADDRPGRRAAQLFGYHQDRERIGARSAVLFGYEHPEQTRGTGGLPELAIGTVLLEARDARLELGLEEGAHRVTEHLELFTVAAHATLPCAVRASCRLRRERVFFQSIPGSRLASANSAMRSGARATAGRRMSESSKGRIVTSPCISA